ncbi:hemolysin precursor [mine drainage metagenome]|uniref:Hemolysin n=1 Tax=mine drainage metagenome TaxID=410659 RepID=A0A1J5QIW4_9ZZZZ
MRYPVPEVGFHGAPERRCAVVLLTLAALAASATARAGVEVAAQGDAAQRPQLRDAGGVPVVDIAPPDSRGVSQNRFTRFDVDAAGVVLNNAAQPAHSALLGAEIGANAALRDGAARAILAEVVGDAASSLRGAIEIAGTRADLIIANPNGIACDGCSFIGSGLTVLAAARVLRDAQGHLDDLQTEGGVLQVGRRGMLAEQVDRLELVARRMRVEGAVHAHELHANVGHLRQAVDGALRQVFDLPGAAPKFALDVAELGAMQADRIELRVTERGAGVRSAGTLHATVGALELRADGRLELSGALRGGGVILHGTRIDMRAPSVVSGGDVRIDAGDTLHASGAEVDAVGAINVRADKALAFSHGRWNAGGDAKFSARTLLNNAAKLGAESLHVQSGDHIANSAGGTFHGTFIDLETSWLSNPASVIRARDIRLSGDTLDNRHGTIEALASLHLVGARVDNTFGTLESQGDLLVDASASLDNIRGSIHSTNGFDLQVGDCLDNSSGELASDHRMRISVGSSLRNDGGWIRGESGVLAIDAPEAALDNASGTIRHEQGELRIDVQQLNNAQGHVIAPTLVLHAAGVDNVLGSLVGEKRFDGRVELLRNAHGSVHGERVTLYAEQLDNRSEGSVGGGTVELGGRLIGNLGGTLMACDALELRSKRLDNRGGHVEGGAAEGALRVRGETIDNFGGLLHARGDVDIVLGAALRNASGTVQGRGVELQVGQRLDNVGGVLVAAVDARIAAERGIDSRSGQISAGGQLRLDSHETTLDNAFGRLSARGPLSWHGRSLDNRSGRIEAARIELGGDTLLNGLAGRVVAAGDVTATFPFVDNDDGLLQAIEGELKLNGDVLHNHSGHLLAGTDVTTVVRLLHDDGAGADAHLPSDASR